MIKQEKKRVVDMSMLFGELKKTAVNTVFVIEKDGNDTTECQRCGKLFVYKEEKTNQSRSPYMIASSQLLECPYCGTAHRTSI